MAAINLLGGTYVARSVIANAQRCLNLFPEINPKDAEVPVTHYLTPGLTLLASGPIQAPWRGLYLATNGVLYGVLGTNFYEITSDWGLILRGTIPSKSTPVAMVDNAQVLVLVDGSNVGWTWDWTNLIFAQISDPNFFGGDTVGYADTFLILNQPNTRGFYTSLSNEISFNALYYALKTGFSDQLITLVVNHVEIWLIGQRTTEVWANAGTSGLPYQRVPGVFIQHGCVAKYSAATYNLQLFWLSQDNNGQALVLLGSGYKVSTISTPAVAQAMAKYSTISDAIGFVYQQGTHVFYVLTFPSADATWVYDANTGLWHEECSIDQNGVEHRVRGNCTAFAYGQNIVGDWQNGNLYALDINNQTENGNPIIRRRGFPHIVNDGKLAQHVQFIANMETGQTPAGVGEPTPNTSGPLGEPALEPTIYLRWSDDRGNSWGEPIGQSMGATGEYITRPSWRDLGQSFDRVYELYWSENVNTALNGAYLDAVPLPI
jgi:hypothetical protein